ncbi:Serine/threonine-protein kinase HAL4/SAT4 [Nakaseomyces bracarensis]|uniref:non-specific serine/threonine protein kinase n=1 Tax=Nakaseomyces bracarensis TaxID=273131 RepID=A0ABR4NYQ1_9SACH
MSGVSKVIGLFRSGSKKRVEEEKHVESREEHTPVHSSSESILSEDLSKHRSSPATRSTSTLASPEPGKEDTATATTVGTSTAASMPSNTAGAAHATMASPTAISVTTSNVSHSHCQRFMVHEDGTHEHHLKNARRQEKLTSMIKNIMKSNNPNGAQKKLRNEARSAVPDIIASPVTPISPQVSGTQQFSPQNSAAQAPSLFAGYMKQVVDKEGKMALNGPISGAFNGDQKVLYQDDTAKVNGDQLILPQHYNDSLSFAEKYGSCKEILGKGAFGVVRICHKKVPDNPKVEKLYAVKEFKRKASEPKDKFSKRLTSEFCISSSLHHVNIVDTLDLFQDANGDYCEVMEYCAGGDLFTLIIAAGKLEYMEADCFFKQLIRGVVYMHEMGVCHRDLKPENLILTHEGILKITDFGNSECFKMAWEKDIHLSGGVCGSSPYIAPEEYLVDEFDPRPVDIWACGVIYMAMRTGRQLWNTAKKEDVFYQKYLQGRRQKSGYEPIEKLKRARCRNVIYSMLDPVPHRRINGKQILNSEWGREIKVCYDKHSSLQPKGSAQHSRTSTPIAVK